VEYLQGRNGGKSNLFSILLESFPPLGVGNPVSTPLQASSQAFPSPMSILTRTGQRAYHRHLSKPLD
jgi:hypothetical protein